MSLNWSILSWSQLTKEQLYELLSLRAEVFVVEQDCPYLDPDGKDADALHLLGYEEKKLISYARVFLETDPCIIGRLVVSQKERNKKIGKETMERAISLVPKQKKIMISAQAYLKVFYESLGFKQQGSGYLEDGIPHIPMFFLEKTSD